MSHRTSLKIQEQILLFEPPSNRPPWRSLPEPARREALQIMASLLRQWRALPPLAAGTDKKAGAHE